MIFSRIARRLAFPFGAAAALPFLLVAPSALAQTAPPPMEQRGARPDRPGGQMGEGRMFESLGLSDAQKTQLREAMTAQRERFRPQMEALRAETGLTDAQKQERRTALMQQQRTEMEAAARRILTPEQFTRFTQQREQMQQRGPRGEGQRPRGQMRDGGQQRPGAVAQNRRARGGRAVAGRAQAGRAAQALGLSEAQKTQMQALATRQREAMQALRGQALTVEQRRTQARELATRFRAERQAVLTPEQRTRVQQMRQRGAERMRERRMNRPGTPGHRAPQNGR